VHSQVSGRLNRLLGGAAAGPVEAGRRGPVDLAVLDPKVVLATSDHRVFCVRGPGRRRVPGVDEEVPGGRPAGRPDPQPRPVVPRQVERGRWGGPGDDLAGPADGEAVGPDPLKFGRRGPPGGTVLPVEVDADVATDERRFAGEVRVVEVLAKDAPGR